MRTLLIVLSVVIVLGAGVWIFARLHASSATPPTLESLMQSAVPPAAPGFPELAGEGPVVVSDVRPLKPARTAPPGYKEYRNEQYRFAVFYPTDLTVRVFDEGAGAATITFQNAQTAEGFQIFVVPYKAPQVSAEQFKKDVPSGVMKNAKDITIDGAVATSFFSSNAMLGDTAEIWFIHDGYLFEVTTLKPLAPWLSQIMQSWQFI